MTFCSEPEPPSRLLETDSGGDSGTSLAPANALLSMSQAPFNPADPYSPCGIVTGDAFDRVNADHLASSLKKAETQPAFLIGEKTTFNSFVPFMCGARPPPPSARVRGANVCRGDGEAELLPASGVAGGRGELKTTKVRADRTCLKARSPEPLMRRTSPRLRER